MRVGNRTLSIIVATLLVSCTTSTTPSLPSASGAAASTSAAAPSGPLRIGILIPFTESAIDSDEGASQRRAADLYLKLHGGKLGGRDVQLVYNDESVLDPAINQTRIQQFLTQDHAEILLGGLSDAAAAQLRDAADAAKVVYVDTNAAVNELTRTVAGCKPTCRSDYAFRTTLDAWQMSEPLGEWVAKSQKDAYLAYEDDAFGTESAAAFGDGLAKGGGRVSGKAAVPAQSGADFAKLVGAIKAQPAKAVFAAFVRGDAEAFLKAWGGAGMTAAGYTLYGPGALADKEVLHDAKQAAAGVTTAFSWSSEGDDADTKSFVDAFRKAYTDEATGGPEVPGDYAVEMWDAMLVLDRALTTTKGDAGARALIAALGTTTVKVPGGELAVDQATHGATLDVYIRQVRSSSGELANAVIDRIPKVTDPVR